MNKLLPSFLLLLLVTACNPKLQLKEKAHNQPPIYAIKNVNVIPMTRGGEVHKVATVIINNRKIVSLNGPMPPDAVIIDGKSKWLIPGLIDMHVHVPTDINFGLQFPTRAASIFFSTQDVMTPFVANGITTIFDLNSKAEHFGQRNEIARGDAIGPRMALAALIDGGEGSGRRANTPAEGRQTVSTVKAEGYEFIKVYSHLNIETYIAVIDEANKQGLKVIGHIPNGFRGKLKDAFIPHFGMVAHAEEFAKRTSDFSDDEAKRFAELAKENGTWLAPCLMTVVSIADQVHSLDYLTASPSLQYVHPLLQSKWLKSNNYFKGSDPGTVDHLKKVIDFNSRLVKAFKEAGVNIVAGTDTGTSGVVGGFSLHDEIELLVEAGLTPLEALASGTCLPALWLGIDSEVGTIEVGKYADLVLLDNNPIDDIKNTRKIAGVFLNGKWLDKVVLDKLLSDLSKRNSALKDKFDWKKRTQY
jgi:imidazolonepropionase-like amidohydrolase